LAQPIPKSGLSFGNCATTWNGDLAVAWQRQSVQWLRWFAVKEQSPSPVFKIAETVLLRYKSLVTEKFRKKLYVIWNLTVLGLIGAAQREFS
jgi:hypothetical protein